MNTPNLDQVSSQAMVGLAGERGLTPAVTPAGEEAARVRKPSRWKRALPFLFFALSLFALASMALGLSAMGDDGWSISDAVQLALMVLLVFGAFTQARSVVRMTPAGRWLNRGNARPAAPAGAAPKVSGYTLDAVSAEYLSAVRPAAATAMSRTAAAKRAGSGAFDRVSVWVVLVLAVLAFVGMLFVLGWVLYSVGPADPSVWLTAPFTALTGLGVFQLFKSASQMSFRGRPFSLLSRTFRDSVRVWGSGSMATKVAVTTTATASIASAAVLPVLAPQDTLYDIFVIDSASAAIYRIDLQTSSSSRAQRDLENFRPIALATTTTPVTLSDGKKLPKGSLLVVMQGPQERVQVILGFRPNNSASVNLGRIEPPLPGAQFTGGAGKMHALQPDGSLWHVDLATAVATKAGTVAGPLGPLAFDDSSGTLVMLSGSEVIRFNPQTGAELRRTPFSLPIEGEVCGLAVGPDGAVFLGLADNPEVHIAKAAQGKLARVVPTGEAAPSPCDLAVALRR